MTADALFSLLPLILLALTAVGLVLLIGFYRNLQLSFALAMGGLLLALVSLLPVAGVLPQQATPLLIMDSYALFFSGLTLVTALLLLPLCHEHWRRQTSLNDEFYLLFLLAVMGALVLVASNHFVSLFLGLELLSLPLVIMVGYPFKPGFTPSLEAAVKYLVLSGAASAMLLFGIALIYLHSGTLAFAPLEPGLIRLPGPQNPLLLTGLILALAGIAFKLSLVPFHFWTPDVYQGAPLPATALLATLAKGALFALLLRFYLLSEGYLIGPLVWALTLIAIASMLAGNLLALLQDNLKRLLAYSSIGHFGYLLVALLAVSQSLGTALAVEAVSYYLVAYLFSTLAAFAVLVRLSGEDREAETLEDCRGLFWRHPWLATTLTLAMLSLAGIPLTIGFVGKFYIFAAAVEESLWLVLLVVVIASGIGLFYYLRVILMMTHQDAGPESDEASAPHWSSHTVTGILVAATLWFGVYPAPLITLIRHLTLAVN
ncbi:NADH-quinone oxidoreductase subunit N [Motiliproteus sp. SC1-56]|uniref:NADH-quinone oxidoreductase subunit N n=1 Tax=Motiliproteus sp. SC1-56 TaxID=2799565 RepID=UPI001A8D653D|nr:NADH-quinone oxidoreductase subunit N [Motiliproteus sp. SC1-56]